MKEREKDEKEEKDSEVIQENECVRFGVRNVQELMIEKKSDVMREEEMRNEKEKVVRFGVWNVQGLKGAEAIKMKGVMRMMIENKIDVMLLTEIHINVQSESETWRQVCDANGYDSFVKMRPPKMDDGGRGGGGVSICVRREVMDEINILPYNAKKEVMSVKIRRGNEEMMVCVVYAPPNDRRNGDKNEEGWQMSRKDMCEHIQRSKSGADASV